MEFKNGLRGFSRSLVCKSVGIIFTFFGSTFYLHAEPTAEEWHDYLIQDTCRDSLGNPIEGDPYNKDECPNSSNLKPGERVFGGFKFSNQGRVYGIWSLPRLSPNGEVGFVLFDSASEVRIPKTGEFVKFEKGMFDLDDPHCKVQGSECEQDGDVDIVDLVEAYWDSSSSNIVSVIGTAHGGSSGYIGFTSTSTTGAPELSADGWLLGLSDPLEGEIRQTNDAAIWVYADEMSILQPYQIANGLEKDVCGPPLGQTSEACRTGYNLWLKISDLYMGENKTFRDVMLSIHTFSYEELTQQCKHLELFLHSKEYGLMSHQVWKVPGCYQRHTIPAVGDQDEIKSDVTNIGCEEIHNDGDIQKNMIHSPMAIRVDGKDVVLERVNCARAIHTALDYAYHFDPRSFSQPSKPDPSVSYSNTKVVDEAGYGNVLLDGNFSRDNTGTAWTFVNALHVVRTQNIVEPAPLNQALELHCYFKVKPSDDISCENSSVYQDVNISLRAPGMIGKEVDFGVRVAQLVDRPLGDEAKGTVYLYQLDQNGALIPGADIAQESFVIEAIETNWPNPVGKFVESRTKIDSRTSTIRFQVFIDEKYHAYMIDDAFVTRRE